MHRADGHGVRISQQIIAFEIEGAGVWNNVPFVIIIKGICDYADRHKTNE